MKKGKIEKDGRLYIERAGKFKGQNCPYGVSVANSCLCGDWCPHFHEPVEIDGDIILKICNGTRLYFDKADFTDGRINHADNTDND